MVEIYVINKKLIAVVIYIIEVRKRDLIPTSIKSAVAVLRKTTLNDN